MNGTTLRVATAAACIAALAAPGAAFAAKTHHRVAKKNTATKTATAPKITVVVPHDYDAGGNGAGSYAGTSTKVNLFDPVQLAQDLGNNVLGQLGLPPIQLPTI